MGGLVGWERGGGGGKVLNNATVAVLLSHS
jgi:hypothetical protein